MLHHGVERLFRNHRAVLTRLRIHIVVQILNDLAKTLLCLLVQVADGDTRSQHGVVGMCCSLVGSRLSSQVVQLDRSNSFVDTVNYLASDFDGINVVHVKAIAQLCHTGCDLVEANFFFASVCGGE